MRHIFEKFLQISRGKQIGVVVCLLHLFAVFALVIHHFATFRLRPSKPMIVRTIVPVQSPPKIKAPVAVSAAPKKPAPAPAVAKLPTVEAPKNAIEKTPVKDSPKKTIAKTAPPTAKVPKLEEIKSAIPRPFITSAPSKPALTLPSRIEPVSIKAVPEIAESKEYEASYSEMVAASIQQALDLPELGEVKMRVEINRAGKVTQCEVLDAKSLKNSEFLKKQLPELHFPCLNDYHVDQPSISFTITFRNRELH